MAFRITGLDPKPFAHLFGLSDEALAAHGAVRYVADSKPGYPDRIAVRDVEIGETLLLVNFVHHDVDNPYRASHAIFVSENATERYDRIDAVPEVLRVRMVSLRAFDAAGEMVDADLVDGREIETLIARFFADPKVAYLHAHYAKRGCYAARIDRG